MLFIFKMNIKQVVNVELKTWLYHLKCWVWSVFTWVQSPTYKIMVLNMENNEKLPKQLMLLSVDFSSDVRETFWAETETKPETHVSKTEMRQDIQNLVRNETETFKIRDETLQLPRRFGASTSHRDIFPSMTYGETHWQWKKLYGLIKSHHGEHFLFVILWGFALYLLYFILLFILFYFIFLLYFDNYYWIINGLCHKELQLQCCRHELLCLSQFAGNWN